MYWAVGAFDGCVVFEAPDEETAASLLLALGNAGNVRTQTMRLYDEAEFASIVSEVKRATAHRSSVSAHVKRSKKWRFDVFR